MTRSRALPFVVLAFVGAAWGMTQPMSKIAVSTGHMPLGLIFWQQVIGAGLLLAITRWRGQGVPMTAPYLRLYLLIALLGTVLPNAASYAAARHLPSGVLSILLSLVPVMAFPIALALALDRFRWLRLLGLVLGLAGVFLIAAPEANLPDTAQVIWIPIALIASAFYAIEGNVVARWGMLDLTPVQLLTGASVVGAVIAAPLALASGQWITPVPLGTPEGALVAASVLHAFAYTGYVWLVSVYGPVFAVQVSYLVTLFGVGWAMLILGETYATPVWGAMVVMLAGVALVQPRPRAMLAPDAGRGQNAH